MNFECWGLDKVNTEYALEIERIFSKHFFSQIVVLNVQIRNTKLQKGFKMFFCFFVALKN